MKVASFESPNIPKNTYPDMDDDFQSKLYPGLYFMGPLMHALDYRKSAGGFIHGFRNTGANTTARLGPFKYLLLL